MDKAAVLAVLLGIIGAIAVTYLISTEPTVYGSVSLSITTNTASISSNGSVGFNVAVTNKQDYSVYLPAADDWPGINGLGYPGTFASCGGAEIYPMRIAMFKGNYSIENISSAGQPLDPTGTRGFIEPLCPVFLPHTYIGYLFAPSSDSAKVMVDIKYLGAQNETVGTVFNISASYGFDAIGYWMPEYRFYNFTPGTYTIVAGDEWNQTAITHFSVV